MDLLQAPHTLSGIEMALWDALGKARGEPVWSMLGYRDSHRKIPYASLLFGDTPQETLERGRTARADGFTAAKFGWGPIGRGTVKQDAEHFVAAREGIGEDGHLMVDVGQIFGEDVEAAAARLPALEAAQVRWFEEPFHASAIEAYGALSERGSPVKTAGGEGAHNIYMARHLIAQGKVGYVQIDAGRIGGIGPSKAVADLAVAAGITYVNHTFTSHLALSASLQPYAGLADHVICEYPAAPKQLAVDITRNHIARDADGHIRAPAAPGLGMDVDIKALRPYVVDTEIKVNGKVLYATPPLD